eukprot:CAMPEP_0206160312 /NCGR_PEP_ID=MMETSP1474-20131121/6651_1 /ASSEMBLY_ACC=CAM_ASM_001110 /TAXON_ID=97495 /ORGANISM="Imantonia sp., Strain RCC918" /LENGTH=190 /DNA_ID=CAMNT_0053561575 /DNA_START=181 /DNA_END=755 /DNA_ORIENTATION=-
MTGRPTVVCEDLNVPMLSHGDPATASASREYDRDELEAMPGRTVTRLAPQPPTSHPIPLSRAPRASSFWRQPSHESTVGPGPQRALLLLPLALVPKVEANCSGLSASLTPLGAGARSLRFADGRVARAAVSERFGLPLPLGGPLVPTAHRDLRTTHHRNLRLKPHARSRGKREAGAERQAQGQQREDAQH